MKKLLSILAVLAIVSTCCIMGFGTVLAAPAESSPDDFLVFDGVLEEYVGEGGDVVIPASLGVKEIAADSFYKNLDITSIVIPEGVKTIGSMAFFYCENLVSVTFPYSLENLSQHEFSGCAITEITIPGNCTDVSYGCFSSCTYLEKLTLSYGVRDIMPLAFQGTSITKVVFPETVELICGAASFGNNRNAEVGTIEYYICNPDCVIGSAATTIPKAQKKVWDTTSNPWSHNKAAATYKIYVIEGSAVDKFLTESGEQLLSDEGGSAKDDALNILRKDAQYFKDLPENQKGYGTPKPSTSTGTTGGDGGNGGSGTDGGTGTDGNGGTGTDVSGNNNGGTTSNGTDKNNTNGAQTIITTQGGDNSSLIVIICVIGGVMLLAIIVVVILAATGVLFGKEKSEPKNEVSPEALAAALALLQNGANAAPQEETETAEAPQDETVE